MHGPVPALQHHLSKIHPFILLQPDPTANRHFNTTCRKCIPSYHYNPILQPTGTSTPLVENASLHITTTRSYSQPALQHHLSKMHPFILLQPDPTANRHFNSTCRKCIPSYYYNPVLQPTGTSTPLVENASLHITTTRSYSQPALQHHLSKMHPFILVQPDPTANRHFNTTCRKCIPSYYYNPILQPTGTSTPLVENASLHITTTR